MTNIRTTVTILGVSMLGMFALKAVAGQEELQAKAKAPDFSAKGTDGKTHTLKSLTKDGPVAFYFVKIGCPVNQRAIPHFNAVTKAYQGKAKLIGVIDGNMETAKEWKSDNRSPMTLLADEDKKIIRAYKAGYSPWVVLVGKDGKVVKTLPGGSRDELTEVSKFLATSAKVTMAKLDFAGAPRGGG